MTMSAEGLVLTPIQADELLTRLERIEGLLTEREKARARAIPAHPMSPREVAEIVGKHERTVIRWLNRRALRSVKIGGVRLVRPVDLERFLEPKGDR